MCSEFTVPGLNSELSPDTENIAQLQLISNQMLLPNTQRNILEENLKIEKEENLEDLISQRSIKGVEHINNSFGLLFPAIAKKEERPKKRGFCCCRKRAKRMNIVDVKQMRTFGLWKWFLHRMLLAVRVINALKNIQMEIEIYGAKGESQTTASQRRMSTILIKDEENSPKCVNFSYYIFSYRFCCQSQNSYGFGCFR